MWGPGYGRGGWGRGYRRGYRRGYWAGRMGPGPWGPRRPRFMPFGCAMIPFMLLLVLLFGVMLMRF